MEDVLSFSKRIKTKYPEYSDINDTDLVRRIVQKFPEYAEVVDTSSFQPQSIARTPIEGSVDNLLEPPAPQPAAEIKPATIVPTFDSSVKPKIEPEKITMPKFETAPAGATSSKIDFEYRKPKTIEELDVDIQKLDLAKATRGAAERTQGVVNVPDFGKKISADRKLINEQVKVIDDFDYHITNKQSELKILEPAKDTNPEAYNQKSLELNGLLDKRNKVLEDYKKSQQNIETSETWAKKMSASDGGIFQKVLSGVNAIDNSLGKSFMAGGLEPLLDIASFVSAAQDYHNPGAGKKLETQVSNAKTTLGKAMKSTEEKLKDTFFEDAAAQALRMLPGMGAGLAATAVGGPMAGSAFWAMQGAGQIYSDLKEDGVPTDIAFKASIIGGIPYALIENMQVGKIFGKGLIREFAKKGAMAAVKRFPIETGKEITEEVLQNGVTSVAEYIPRRLSDKTNEDLSEFSKRLLKESAETAKNVAAPISILGATMGGAHIGLKKAQSELDQRTARKVQERGLEKARIAETSKQIELDKKTVSFQEIDGKKYREIIQNGKSFLIPMEEGGPAITAPEQAPPPPIDITDKTVKAAPPPPPEEKVVEWDKENEAIEKAKEEIKQDFPDIGEAKDVSDILTRDKRPREVMAGENISNRGKRIVDRLFVSARDNVFKDKDGNGREGAGAADDAVDEGLKRMADFGHFTVVAVDIMNLGGKNKKSSHKEANRGLQEVGQIIDEEAAKYNAKTFKTGGDELLPMIYADAETTRKIMQEVDRRAEEAMIKRGDDKIPHPKHDGMVTGFGRITWGMANTSNLKSIKSFLSERGVNFENDRNALMIYADLMAKGDEELKLDKIAFGRYIKNKEGTYERTHEKAGKSGGESGETAITPKGLAPAVEPAATDKKPAEEVVEPQKPAEEPTSIDSLSKTILSVMNKGVEKGKEHTEQTGQRLATSILESIKEKNVHDLRQKLHPMNRGWRAGFESVTGEKLPNTVKGTEDVIRKFVGEESYKKQKEASDAGREEKKKEWIAKDRQRRIEKNTSHKVKIGDTIKTMKQHIEDSVADGYDRIEEVKKGATKQWRLWKGTNTYFVLKTRGEMEHAEDIIKSKFETKKPQEKQPPKKEEAKQKEPWEMTKEEYAALPGEKLPEVYHRNAVISAFSEGKDVPAEVLKDYPELKKPEKKEFDLTDTLKIAGAGLTGEAKKLFLSATQNIMNREYEVAHKQLDKTFALIDRTQKSKERIGAFLTISDYLNRRTKETNKKISAIGENPDGNPIYQDKNGVRHFVKNGIRVTQPVALIPTRAGIEYGIKSKQEMYDSFLERQFLTKAEIAEFEKKAAKDKGLDGTDITVEQAKNQEADEQKIDLFEKPKEEAPIKSEDKDTIDWEYAKELGFSDEKIAETKAKLIEARQKSKEIPSTASRDDKTGIITLSNAFNKQEREKKHQQIIEKHYGKGADKKEKNVWIVMGLPAAGKNSNLAVPILKENGAMLIDNDVYKEEFEEYQNGLGANAVHFEASDIIEPKILELAKAAGDNIVIPRLGKKLSTVEKLITDFKKSGYEVHLRFLDLPTKKAEFRAITRFLETGRFVDPEFIAEINLTPKENYYTLKNREDIQSYELWTSDVPKGQKAKLLESFERPGIPGSGTDESRRREQRDLENVPEGRGDEKKPEVAERKPGHFYKGDIVTYKDEVLEVIKDYAPVDYTIQTRNIDTKIFKTLPGSFVKQLKLLTEPDKKLTLEVEGDNQNGNASTDKQGEGALAGEQAVNVPGASTEQQPGPVNSESVPELRPDETGPSGKRPAISRSGSPGGGGTSLATGNEPAAPGSVTLHTDSKNNFQITDDLNIGKGSLEVKYRENLSAIRLLKKIESENRKATPEEQLILSRYVGWGAYGNMFSPTPSEAWKPKHDEVKALLTPEEYSDAARSSVNAHFTTPTVIRAMWKAVQRFGYTGGHVLEGGSGIGHFVGLGPEQLPKDYTGIELDSITGRIAQQLYQSARINIGGFEEFNINKPKYTVTIGNVPFSGDIKPFDKNASRYGIPKGTVLHDFFFLKSMYGLQPGGVMALITSRYTMDKLDRQVRTLLAGQANFLGAIRLPNNAFKGNAGTEVVTDIIFMQKREPGEAMTELTKTFIETDKIKVKKENGDLKEFARNRYYSIHKEMLLGKETAKGTQYSPDGDYTLEPRTDTELSEDLEAAIQALPSNIMSAAVDTETEKMRKDAVETLAPTNISINEFYEDDKGNLFQKNEKGTGEPLNTRTVVRQEPGKGEVIKELVLTEREKANIRAQMKIKKAVKSLYYAQAESPDNERLKPLQAKLNQLYDAFLRDYGPLNKPTNAGLVTNDSGSSYIQPIELYDRIEKKAKKSDIFTKRIYPFPEDPKSADSENDALVYSLQKYGALNIPYMADLLGQSEENVKKALLDNHSIFTDPISGNLILRDDYLSGNVRQKIKDAEAANRQELAANIEELKKVLPKDKLPGEPIIQMNSSMLEEKDIKNFIKDVFGIERIEVNHIRSMGNWTIGSKYVASPKVTETFGTSNLYAPEILAHIINGKTIVIKDNMGTSLDPDWVVNQEETVKANEKAEIIKQEFKNWLWTDGERSSRITKQFNENYNSVVNRNNDGSHLKFPGMNASIQMRESQKNGVFRIISSAMNKINTMLAHEVGGGKTFIMAAAAMELRRLGIKKKQMIVIPNHMVEQWKNDFQFLYPAAKVLVATDKTFSAKMRKSFLNRIAFGDWDAIIIKKSHFERIPVSKDIQVEYFQKRLEVFEKEYRARYGDPESKNKKKSQDLAEKKMQAKLENFRQKIANLLASPKDEGVVTFDKLGVDMLYVDEADLFKNVDYSTQLTGVLGLGSMTGGRATTDMQIKVQLIQKNSGGGGIVFATGTPISNTLAEAYHMMRYLQPEDLDALKITNFDEWRSMFADYEEIRELSGSGKGYKVRKRFSKIINVPELMRLIRKVWDIQTADMLEEKGILVRGKNLPMVKRHTIAAPLNERLLSYRDHLGRRELAIKGKKPEAGHDNVLSIMHDGALAALDMRMINPTLKDDPESKLNMAAKQAAELYHRDAKEKLTGLIFWDRTAPGSDTRFDVYAELKRKLLKQGVKEEEIAFIHDYKTDAQKQTLFLKMNRGDIRILIGNTQKMGAGTNIQKKLKWLMHLDAPYRPRDIIQREGRIIRQGNENKEVEIYSYVTKGTLDSWFWGLLETKVKTINQVMSDKSDQQEIEETIFGEPKIYAIDNPLIKESEEVREKINKLQLLQKAHNTTIARSSSEIAFFEDETKGTRKKLALVAEDIKTRGEKPKEFSVTVMGQEYTEKEKSEAYQAIMKQFDKEFPLEMQPGEKLVSKKPVGKFGGFDFYLEKERSTYKNSDGEIPAPAHSIVFKGEFDYSYNAESPQSLGHAFADIFRRPESLISLNKGRIEEADKDIAEYKKILEKKFDKGPELTAAINRGKEIDRILETELDEDVFKKGDEKQPATLQRTETIQGEKEGQKTTRNLSEKDLLESGWKIAQGKEFPEGADGHDKHPDKWFVLTPGGAKFSGPADTREQAVQISNRKFATEQAEDQTDWAAMESERKKHVGDEDYFGAGSPSEDDNIDDFLDDQGPQIGLSLRVLPAHKNIGLNSPEAAAALIKSVNPEVEKRMKASEGIGKVPIWEKAKAGLESIKNSFTRHYKYLGKGDERAMNILRIYEEIPNYSKVTAMNIIRSITAPLGKEEYMAFKRYVILDDLLKDAESPLYKNKELPFGYENVAEIEDDLHQLKQVATVNPLILQAINKRKAILNSIVVRQVDAGLLSEKVLGDDRYYHHQVLEKVREKQIASVGVGSKDVRQHTKGYQRGRTGSALDYNTNYFESEFEVLAQSLTQLGTAETLDRVKGNFDISKTLKRQAKAENLRLLEKIGGDETMETLKQFSNTIGMANSMLADLAASGEIPDGPYQEIVDSLADKDNKEDIDDPRWFNFLNWLMATDNPGAAQAGMIYKAIQEKIRFIKTTLGENYKTYKDMIPDGYRLWQPKEGNLFFRVNTVSDNVIQNVLEGAKDLQEADIKQAMSMGGKLPEWVIPENLAKTLDDFHSDTLESDPAKFARFVLTSWKQYILLNPMRALKYNINNLSGDLDIALAFNPKILKYAFQASKDLYNFNVRKKTPSKELMEALRLGVINSGMTVAEIPDISKEGFFRALTGDQPNLIEKYWSTVKDFTTFRENILRLSSYRFFQDELKAGRRPVGASKPAEVEAIRDPLERAAKLSRDLVGDYGNISSGGQWLRSHLLPFYSWAEINAPRYYRLFKNIPYDKSPVSAAAKTTGMLGISLAKEAALQLLKVHLFYLMVSLWNHLKFPDEEKELYEQRRQLHLILGRNEDGTIKTSRIQGAFSDALDWIGAGDYIYDISDLVSGRSDWTDLAIDAPKKFTAKLIGMVTPLVKLPAELLSGLTFYPDPWKPRPIRDKVEHTLKAVSLDIPYKAVTGKPMPKGQQGIKSVVKGMLFYNTDPGEAAYFETARLKGKFLEKAGDEKPGFGMTTRSNTLYNYRRAKQYGDKEAEAKYLKKFMELGGKDIDIHEAERRQHPIFNLAARHRKDFLDSLKPGELAAVDKAITWYKNLYDFPGDDPWQLLTQAKLRKIKLSDEQRGAIQYAILRGNVEMNPDFREMRILNNLDYRLQRKNKTFGDISEMENE